jgi:N utilization substance protein B
MVEYMKPQQNHKRTAARLGAVQALYQLEYSGLGVDSVVLEFRTHRLGADIDGAPMHEADDDFFADVVRGVVKNQAKLDPFIQKKLAKGWTLARIDSTARAILRCGLYELANRADVPVNVVIDEYVELARDFFEEGSEPGFINGVLDSAARELRDDETHVSRA